MPGVALFCTQGGEHGRSVLASGARRSAPSVCDAVRAVAVAPAGKLTPAVAAGRGECGVLPA
jgi:hypothetical protein